MPWRRWSARSARSFQAVKRAVDSGDEVDYRRALAAFDSLPAWQKERILRVAMARAEEVTQPDDPDGSGQDAAPDHPDPADESRPIAD
ncbi:MAG: hypothetical protein WDO24_19360 [Pseudomonadota bacterium]